MIVQHARLRWGRVLGAMSLGMGLAFVAGASVSSWSCEQRAQLERRHRSALKVRLSVLEQRLEAHESAERAPARASAEGSWAPDSAAAITVDIESEDRDLQDVMNELGEAVGWNILVAPGVMETVTMRLREVPWPDAVGILARLTRCDVEEVAPRVLLLSQAPKVTIQFSDANVRTVLQLLAAYSGKSIVISPRVQGRVCCDLKDVHWLEALQVIVDSTAGGVLIQDSPDLLRVMHQDELAD